MTKPLKGVASFLTFASNGNIQSCLMRILLVDDDSLIRWSLHLSLTSRGHEVVSADCGNEALSLLRSKSFDIVLTDLKLPGADGFRVAETARELSPEIPVIMISAHGNADVQQRVLENHINFFVDKPLIIQDVISLVESFSHV